MAHVMQSNKSKVRFHCVFSSFSRLAVAINRVKPIWKGKPISPAGEDKWRKILESVSVVPLTNYTFV